MVMKIVSGIEFWFLLVFWVFCIFSLFKGFIRLLLRFCGCFWLFVYFLGYLKKHINSWAFFNYSQYFQLFKRSWLYWLFWLLSSRQCLHFSAFFASFHVLFTFLALFILYLLFLALFGSFYFFSVFFANFFAFRNFLRFFSLFWRFCPVSILSIFSCLQACWELTWSNIFNRSKYYKKFNDQNSPNISRKIIQKPHSVTIHDFHEYLIKKN